MAPQPKLAILLCENSGAVVEWLMDKFNLDVSLVARVGGHSAPRTYRNPHLCFDSDGEEDCRKVRQGENDHQSTGDGVDHEWWCVSAGCDTVGGSRQRDRVMEHPAPHTRAVARGPIPSGMLSGPLMSSRKYEPLAFDVQSQIRAL